MGENALETFLRILLIPLIERFLASKGRPAWVGGNQFVYWREGEPTVSLAPDVLVVPGVAPGTLLRSLKTWEHGAPSFALEVVSLDWEKDYFYVPGRYMDMGVRELVVFDPSSQERAEGHRWQVFRRVGKRFLRVEVTDEDRVRSKVLGCWLRVVGEGDAMRVRLATGKEGELLFPTSDEAERARADAEHAARQSEAARADAERTTRQAETARADAERARAEAAEAELAKLRALLGKRQT